MPALPWFLTAIRHVERFRQIQHVEKGKSTQFRASFIVKIGHVIENYAICQPPFQLPINHRKMESANHTIAMPKPHSGPSIQSQCPSTLTFP
jgi:hypothetical protein